MVNLPSCPTLDYRGKKKKNTLLLHTLDLHTLCQSAIQNWWCFYYSDLGLRFVPDKHFAAGKLSWAPSPASCGTRTCPDGEAEVLSQSRRAVGLHTLCRAHLLPPHRAGDREPGSPATALQPCLSQPCLQWLKLSLNLRLPYLSETRQNLACRAADRPGSLETCCGICDELSRLIPSMLVAPWALSGVAVGLCAGNSGKFRLRAVPVVSPSTLGFVACRGTWCLTPVCLLGVRDLNLWCWLAKQQYQRSIK